MKTPRGFSLAMGDWKISLAVMMISSSLPQRRLELKNVNDHRI